ncbi:MAG: nucleoside recognition domain-containing protein [Clostridia bacterium]
MLNIVWPIFIIISFLYAIFSGNLENLNTSIFNSTDDAVKLTINLLGTMCFWNGVMQIASKTNLIEKLTKFLEPVIKFLFPEQKNNKKIKKEISMNMIANILGLGNAATPLGLKAMQSMQEENKEKDTLTDSMLMFIVINTASIQIIPTTVIAIRNSLGSKNPTAIVFPVWIATICAAIARSYSCKNNNKKEKIKVYRYLTKNLNIIYRYNK